MNNRIIDTLQEIQDQYGDMVFYNQQKVKNLLNDLAPGLQKERIHIIQFLEINGYFQLKYAGHSYPLVRARLAQSYASTYAVHDSVAIWILDVFSELLGFSDFENMDDMLKEDENFVIENAPEAPPEPEPKPEPEVIKPVKKAIPLVSTPVKPPIAGPIVSGPISTRIAADMHSIAILPNGRVVAAGPDKDGQCNVHEWRDIVAVAAGPGFSVGLKVDGRVIASGLNRYGQCNVRLWHDVIKISVGARHTVGLKRDGTVVATGQNKHGECDVSRWRNIIHVSAGYMCTFGIKKDHSVLVAGAIKEVKMSGVQDIVNPYPYRALALKKNGRLAAIRQDDTLKNSISKWRGVKQISAGPDYFAGLFKDGTVRVLAYYWVPSGIELSPNDWTDITAIAAGRFHLLGVKKDGSIMAVMMHPGRDMNKGQCNVKGWSLI